MSLSSQTAIDVFLIVSNLALWIPAAQAFYYMHKTYVQWMRAVYAIMGCVYFIMGITSALYHLCDSFPNACLFSYGIHIDLDFFFAQLIIPMSSLYLIYFTPSYQWIWFILFFIFFAPGVWVVTISMGNALWVQGVISAVAIGIVAIYWMYYYAVQTKKLSGRCKFPPYNWMYLLMAIALTGLSISLFSVQNIWHTGYWAIHSLWHVLAALGQYFLLKIREVGWVHDMNHYKSLISSSINEKKITIPTCLVCLNGIPDTQFEPCNHLCGHLQCIEMAFLGGKMRNCPLCGGEVESCKIVSA